MANIARVGIWRMCLLRATTALAVLAAFGLGVVARPSAQAQSLTVLYSFTGPPDGDNPIAGGGLGLSESDHEATFVTFDVPEATSTFASAINPLVGANPSKIYQASIHIFCTTIGPMFGQFPTEVNNPPNCNPITRQGLTASVAAVEFGVVTTDLHGNGKFTVVVGPIASGTYNLEFTMRNGVGCGVVGGAGNNQCYDDCSADFQSPGPFGTTTTITIP